MPHTNQHLYHAFYQLSRHDQGGTNGEGRSTHMGGEEEAAEADDLRAENEAVGMVGEFAEEKAN